MAKKWNFKDYLKKLKRKKSALPAAVGQMARTHFVTSWRMQRFNDTGTKPWAPRKRDKDPGRAILVGGIRGGSLRNSISVKQATFRRIRVGSYGLPYASRHNRGLAGMTQRQFLGPSKTLTKKVRKLVRKEIKKVFN